ncbi:MAG: hypothetical protein ACI4GW_14040 [Lachnospiraceae bacterium]
MEIREKDFVKYLFDSNFLIIEPKVLNTNNGVDLDWSSDMLQVYNCLEQYSDIIKTYLYKREWGELKRKSNNHVNWSTSPVIEHFHCKINLEQNRLLRGRLYLDTDHKEEIQAFALINKEYE